MRRFIAEHPMAFLASILGGVVVATGLGALALGAGTPVVPLLYVQLGIYCAVPFAVLASVPEREGGAVAVALGAALPLLTFFGWLEHRLAGNSAAGLALATLGAAIVLAGVMLPSKAAPTRPKLTLPATLRVR